MTKDDNKNKGRRRRRRNRKSKQIFFNSVANSSEEETGEANSKFSPSQPSSPPSSESPLIEISDERFYDPYPSEEDEEFVDCVKTYKATFRVNAYKHEDAYCTIKDLPIDVIIRGARDQNRAVEGDVVAISFLSPSNWAYFKGANLLLNSTPANASCQEHEQADRSLRLICYLVKTNPTKRPTGRVVEILKRSPQRATVIGFLSMKPFDDEDLRRHSDEQCSEEDDDCLGLQAMEWMRFIPNDHKFPNMRVCVRNLPDSVKERVNSGDLTITRELLGAEMYEWCENTRYPQARITDVFGRGGEIKSQKAAILFENLVPTAKFSQKSVSCLPPKPWMIPDDELKSRKDLRKVCCFTIDPPSAVDLDDALSAEIVSKNILRIGVHIADVSYFVLPDTDLDTEAQFRSTSVYILQQKLPLLPPELSEELSSLLPGEDRLTFSIMWDINSSGEIVDRWIGRSIINSCCKMSYDFVQDVINKSFDVDELRVSTVLEIYGGFSLKDIIVSLRKLHEISKKLRETRFNDGVLDLKNIKHTILFDEYGEPFDSIMMEKMESSCLVEEFMVLANRSVAEVISRAYPDCALLIRHPELLPRKLKEFEMFCSKHGFELDTSSSGKIHISLTKIMEENKDDSVLCEIVTFYVIKTIQSSVYFCTGDLKGREDEWAHYALSVPLYAHFTSPIRRYPDIIVHRILCAVLDAELMYLKQHAGKLKKSKAGFGNKCFTGLHFDKRAAESTFGREALSVSASKFKILQGDTLGEVVEHCNERRLAGRHAERDGVRLCMWVLLKEKDILVTEARVLSLGPKFMSVYIKNFAVERRISYGDNAYLSIEWLQVTGKLVIDLKRSQMLPKRVGNFCHLEDFMLTEPKTSDLDEEDSETVTFGAWGGNSGLSEKSKPETVFFPLVIESLSYVPVALQAIGGDDGPVDIGVKLYVSSYFA